MGEHGGRGLNAVVELLMALGGILMFRFPEFFARMHWTRREPTPIGIAIVRWMGLAAAVLLVISAVSEFAR